MQEEFKASINQIQTPCPSAQHNYCLAVLTNHSLTVGYMCSKCGSITFFQPSLDLMEANRQKQIESGVTPKNTLN